MSRINSTTTKYAILFFSCVLFHILGTWSLPLIDRDEPRFAEASREMIERGDYTVPYFNNQLRLDKPPLTYWAQVASYHIFGENDFAARFPSAIAAALTAILIFAWGGRIGGERVGWWAAIIFTLSLQTFVHAKAAVADMWLVLFMTLAHWAGYELFQRPTLERFQRRPMLNQGTAVSRPPWAIWKSPFPVFYLALALGFLAKGPIAWTPLLTIGVIIIYTRDWQAARRFKFIGGILLTLVVVALWGIPALIQTHGEFFTVGIGRHVVGRSFMTLEGHGASSFGMYVLSIAVLFRHGVHQFLSVVDQVAVVDSEFVAEQGGRGRRPRLQWKSARCLSSLGHRGHLRHLYSRQHEVTALHAAGVSVACSFACAALAPRSGRWKAALRFYNHRARNCVCVDNNGPRGSADGGAVFPRVSALSSVARVFAAEHAICRGRISGAKSGLVFSIPRSRLSHAAEQASRCRVHERTRSTFYRSADARGGRTFREPTGKLAILYGQRFQHR